MRHENLPAFALVLLVMVSGCISGDMASDSYDDLSQIDVQDEIEEKVGDETGAEETTSQVSSDEIDVQQPEKTNFQIGDVLSNEQIAFTVNSVRKEKVIEQYSEPKSGFVYLICDITIKNIGLEEGYSFNPYFNVEVQDEDFYAYDYSYDSYELPKFFGDTTIDLGQIQRGEIAFEVPEDSESYTFMLKSGALFERNIAYVDLGTIETPEDIVEGKISIDSVEWNWIDYGDLMPGQGMIYHVNVEIQNEGNVIIDSIYDMLIKHEGSEISSKKEIDGYSVSPGDTETDSIFAWITIDEPGIYEFEVTLYNQGSDVPLDTTYEYVKIS